MSPARTAILAAAQRQHDAADEPGVLREVRDFFRQFIVAAFSTYRPEQHYMRGPGPACRKRISVK